MGIENLLVQLVHRYLYLLDVSFHCPGSVGKYKIIFQVPLILFLDQSGENIRLYARCRNPLILPVGAHGGCHGPHY